MRASCKCPGIWTIANSMNVGQGGGALTNRGDGLNQPFPSPHPIAAYRTRLIEKADYGHTSESFEEVIPTAA
jgi:hypothetical protein